jgi:hypothetical protein
MAKVVPEGTCGGSSNCCAILGHFSYPVQFFFLNLNF